MPIPENEIKLLVRLTGLGPVALMRMVGTIRIPLPKFVALSQPELQAVEGEVEIDGDSEVVDIGLRLDAPAAVAPLVVKIGREKFLECLASAISEYSASCAIITNWLGRGDFSTKNIPEHINRSALIFACRTAGRVRAKVLRADASYHS